MITNGFDPRTRRRRRGRPAHPDRFTLVHTGRPASPAAGRTRSSRASLEVRRRHPEMARPLGGRVRRRRHVEERACSPTSASAASPARSARSSAHARSPSSAPPTPAGHRGGRRRRERRHRQAVRVPGRAPPVLVLGDRSEAARIVARDRERHRGAGRRPRRHRRRARSSGSSAAACAPAASTVERYAWPALGRALRAGDQTPQYALSSRRPPARRHQRPRRERDQRPRRVVDRARDPRPGPAGSRPAGSSRSTSSTSRRYVYRPEATTSACGARRQPTPRRRRRPPRRPAPRRGSTGRAAARGSAPRPQDAVVLALDEDLAVRVAQASRWRGEIAYSASSPSRPGKQVASSSLERRAGILGEAARRRTRAREPSRSSMLAPPSMPIVYCRRSGSGTSRRRRTCPRRAWRCRRAARAPAPARAPRRRSRP